MSAQTGLAKASGSSRPGSRAPSCATGGLRVSVAYNPVDGSHTTAQSTRKQRWQPALAYNLANFLRTLALPDEMESWSLTTIREKVVKIGAKIIAHARYSVFQMAEVAVPRDLFRRILDMIDNLRAREPAPC